VSVLDRTYLDRIYKDSLSLLNDLYQLTMAYAHWKEGTAEREAVFHLFFRKIPFGGGFAVACGLGPAIEYIEGLRFREDDLEYMGTLKGNDGGPLFEPGFLDYLRHLSFRCDVDAVPEGTVVFAQEPLIRVTGPILMAQLLETPLLNIVNFQTLIATKAARMKLAAGEDPVIEFGLRRAQGIDGSLAAARAAYAGGCDGTSNLLAGKASQSGGPMPIAGCSPSTRSWSRSRLTPGPCPTTASSWWTPTTPWRACATPRRWGGGCEIRGTR
jgi:nicotinate phosphoribosyltransferase